MKLLIVGTEISSTTDTLVVAGSSEEERITYNVDIHDDVNLLAVENDIK